MKRIVGIAAGALVAGLLVSGSSAQAATIATKPCNGAGIRQVSSGLLFKCVQTTSAAGGVLKWNAGTRCRSASQSVTLGAVVYGCKKSAGKWIWFKKRTITFPTLKLNGGITLLTGGDQDVTPFTSASLAVSGWLTGNNTAVGTANSVLDSYLNVAVDAGRVTGVPRPYHVALTISYIDNGTDQFSFQYDSASGPWTSSGTVTKTNTGRVKTAVFNLCDGGFQRRDNGGDIRIDDRRDGAESIVDVSLQYLPVGIQAWNVDKYGANPYDLSPDSDAIQAVLNQTCSGDTVLFTSGVEGANGYQGYLIDKSLKLVEGSPRDHLTYTSTNPAVHSLMKATPSLLGFILRLWAKGSLDPMMAAKIDYVTLQRIDFDANRQNRKCSGSDGVGNSIDDNWGSSDPGDLMEFDNPGTNPGGIYMDGEADSADPAQDYLGHPDSWSRDIVIQDLTIKNVECGTALSFIGTAHSTIQRVTVQDAGDHNHLGAACALVDNDGEKGGWADGLTVGGPDLTVRDNHIINPSDVGIAVFGGRNQKYINNTVETTEGNHGAFSAISVVPDAYGDSSDLLIQGNQVINNSSQTCGGIHIGINVNTQAFHGGCLKTYNGTHYGSEWSSTTGWGPGCTYEELLSKPVKGLCPSGSWCLTWIHADAGHPIVIKENAVTGAHVNYSVGFIDGPVQESNNKSITPHQTDFAGGKSCQGAPLLPVDKLALLPSLPDWTAYGLTCWG